MKIYKSPVHGGAAIYFGEGSRDMLLEEVDRIAPDRLFMVMDRTVDLLYGEQVRELLPYQVEATPIVFNEGEENKNLSTLQHVAGDLLRGGVNEKSLVLNVGGGVTMDLGSLAASLLGRGIRFAHVATTFNAGWQVAPDDRQAIHFVGERNALGVYRAPEFAIVDPHFMQSEEPEAVASAMAEFVQLALYVGGDVYDRAQAILSEPGVNEAAAIEKTMQACLELRLRMYETEALRRQADEAREYGALLAYGLEVMSEGRLRAGEALYYAMRISAQIARARGAMDEQGYARHERLLDLLPIERPYPPNVRTDLLLYKLHGNNKTLRDNNMMVLLREPGHPAGEPGELKSNVTDKEIGEATEKVRIAGEAAAQR